MYVKFVIFAALSLSLVTVVYASSVSEVCAEKVRGESSCSGNSQEMTCCWGEWDSEDPWGTSKKVCQTCKKVDANTWECSDPEQVRAAGTPNINPEDLPLVEENTTKPPKNDLLPDGNFPLPPLGSDDNIKEPKVPNDLEDLNDDLPTVDPGE